LIKIKNKTLLDLAINRLIKNGFDEIIINIHHFAEQIKDFLGKNKFDADIQFSDESKKLLDTGGGLKNAAWFFNDGKPFLLYNVDIISNSDLKNIYLHHVNSGSIATLVTRKRISERYLLFDENYSLCGWRNISTGEIIKSDISHNCSEFAFSGIHIVNTEIFSFMPEDDKFSMIDLYLSVMKRMKISGYLEKEAFWLDVGTEQRLKEAAANYNKYS